MDNTIPVVLNTAYSSYRDNFLTWAADAYVTKSSDVTELLANGQGTAGRQAGVAQLTAVLAGGRSARGNVGR